MLKQKNVDILMATYNGEKYLREQINSIINQTYNSWNLIIRDDGSKDNTLEIIEEYKNKDDRIKLLEDGKGNLGIVKNFEELLNQSGAEFIMFSDQDDIWDEKKIEIYLEKIEKNQNKEILIHSDANLCDKEGNVIKKSFILSTAMRTGIENTFFNYFVQGATVMITRSMKNFILPFPDEVYLHDRYIHLISELFFERVFIEKSLLLYRQHDNNQVGGKTELTKLIKKRYFDTRDRKLIEYLYNKYGNNLVENKKELMEEYLKITDVKKNRMTRFLNLKKSKIEMPLKKQISLLVKG